MSQSNITNTKNDTTNTPPLQIAANSDLRYKLRITNVGGPATNVILTDDFDANLGDCSYQ